MQKHNAMLTPLIVSVPLAEQGNDRIRWRTRSESINKETAANDETANAWRMAA